MTLSFDSTYSSLKLARKAIAAFYEGTGPQLPYIAPPEMTGPDAGRRFTRDRQFYVQGTRGAWILFDHRMEAVSEMRALQAACSAEIERVEQADRCEICHGEAQPKERDDDDESRLLCERCTDSEELWREEAKEALSGTLHLPTLIACREWIWRAHHHGGFAALPERGLLPLVTKTDEGRSAYCARYLLHRSTSAGDRGWLVLDRSAEVQAKLDEARAELAQSTFKGQKGRKAITVRLLGCVSKKMTVEQIAAEWPDSPDAQSGYTTACTLYQSPLWHKRRAYHNTHPERCPVMIFSAHHGLIKPSRRLRPYDCAMWDRSASEKRAFQGMIRKQLEVELRNADIRPERITLEVHAGAKYVRVLQAAFDEPLWTDIQVEIETPMKGLMIGEQLAWYNGDRETVEAKREARAAKKAEDKDIFIADLAELKERRAKASAIVVSRKANAEKLEACEGFEGEPAMGFGEREAVPVLEAALLVAQGAWTVDAERVAGLVVDGSESGAEEAASIPDEAALLVAQGAWTVDAARMAGLVVDGSESGAEEAKITVQSLRSKRSGEWDNYASTDWIFRAKHEQERRMGVERRKLERQHKAGQLSLFGGGS